MSLTFRYLSIPFNNPFEDQRVSHQDFAQFARECMASLRINGTALGIAQAMIDGYESAFNDYADRLGDKDMAVTYRLGATIDLKESWKLFVAEARRREAQVRSKFDRKTTVYVSIYPRGLKPFQQTKRGERKGLMHQLQMSFADFEDEFPGVAAVFATLKEAYAEADGGQSQKKGKVSGSRNARNLARTILAGHLHGLWLAVAQNNRGNPEVAKVLFNVSIFNKGTNYDNDKLGRLILQVDDREGRPVADAKVEVRTLENQMVQKGRTKTDGRYKGRKLGIGFYDVTVRQVGKVTFKARYQIFDNQDPVREVRMEAEG